jgi:hypothetical protein
MTNGQVYVAAKVVLQDSALVIDGIRPRGDSRTTSVPATRIVVPLAEVVQIERVDTHDKRTMFIMIGVFAILAVVVGAFQGFGDD